jgi:hypothetical protein
VMMSAEQVAGDEHIKPLGTLDHPHARGIDMVVVRRMSG